MKKFFIISAFLCGIFGISAAQASNYPAAAGGACCPQDQATGECYCKFVKYEPCYYNTYRCVQEPCPYTRTCCRQVPEKYCVTKCRMVPQYYQEECCRMVPQYYQVQECTYKNRTICEPCCKYVPKTYWKYCPQQCPTCP